MEPRATGSSRVTLRGETRDLDASASGSSDLALADLVAERARVSASGSSDAIVHVNDVLGARASGSSSIVYGGAPDVEQRASGASDVLPGR